MQEGRRGWGQLGPGVAGGLPLWVEANQGRCLDPLTCLGPSVPAGTPREQEGGLGPPEPAPANANTAAHSTGRRSKAEAQETQLASGSSGAGGVLLPSSPAQSQVPWSPCPLCATHLHCVGLRTDTASGLLALQCCPLTWNVLHSYVDSCHPSDLGRPLYPVSVTSFLGPAVFCRAMPRGLGRD